MRTPPSLGSRARALRPVAFAAALALAVACDRAPTAAPAAPPTGTVMALNGIPILQDEVDDVAAWYAMLEPQFALPHLRRLALSNVIFPLWAARSAEPDRRRDAEARARAALASCRSGTLPSEPALRDSVGNWQDIDISIWRGAFDTPAGSWTDVIESPGCFHVARVDERKDARTPRDETFVLAVLDFPYLDAAKGRAALDEALDESRLVFIEPAWRDVVPAIWQHRLHGDSP